MSFSSAVPPPGRGASSPPSPSGVKADLGAAGRQSRVANALGYSTCDEYDPAGRQVRVIDALGYGPYFVYDAAGRQSCVVDARGNPTYCVYDPAGRQVRIEDALGNSTYFTYDTAGNQTLVADALAGETYFVCDALNRRTASRDPLGQAAYFASDEVGSTARPTPPSRSPNRTARGRRSDKGLWRVERALREATSTRSVRPICHHRDDASMGRLVASFLALRLEVDLQRRLAEQAVAVSWRDQMRALAQVQGVEVEVDGERNRLRTDWSGSGGAAFAAAGGGPPWAVTRLGPVP